MQIFLDDAYGATRAIEDMNHDIIMAKLEKKIKDKRLLSLIRKYLKSGILINGVSVASEEGTPQGGPLSPLLANIMLDELDKELEKRGHKFCRYADDNNVYVKRDHVEVVFNVVFFISEKNATYRKVFKLTRFKICEKYA